MSSLIDGNYVQGLHLCLHLCYLHCPGRCGFDSCRAPVFLMVLLFILGLLGLLLNRRSFLILLMCLELMLLGVSCLFIWFSLVLDSPVGFLFTFYIFAVAAGESAIGLALFVSYFRVRGTISVKSSNLLRG